MHNCITHGAVHCTAKTEVQRTLKQQLLQTCQQVWHALGTIAV